MSPELETLDQLLGGDLPLSVIRNLYPSSEGFQRGILGLLFSGDVLLLPSDKTALARRSWRDKLERFVDKPNCSYYLRITSQGVNRIA